MTTPSENLAILATRYNGATNTLTVANVAADNIIVNANTLEPALRLSQSGAGSTLTITHTGPGNALVIEDSTTPDATPFVIDNAGAVQVGRIGYVLPSLLTTQIPASNYSGIVTNSGSSSYRRHHTLSSNDVELASLGLTGSNLVTYMGGFLRWSLAPSGQLTSNVDGAGAGISVTCTNLTGATSNMVFHADGVAGVGTTIRASGYNSVMGQEAGGTLSQLINFRAQQGSILGTVTSQYGFSVESNLTGATYNHGFYSAIPEGTGRWNLYMAGTAANYLAGCTTISVSNAAAALTITQTGTGNALVVEDSTSPDATPFVITKDGAMVSGYTTPVVSESGGLTSAIQTHGLGTSNSRYSAYNWNSASSAPTLEFCKSYSGVIGTHTLVPNSITLGNIYWEASDGLSFRVVGTMQCVTAEAHTSSSLPTYLTFRTTPSGAVASQEVMRIRSDGGIGVGTGGSAGISMTLAKPITGSPASVSLLVGGVIQPDVTSFSGVLSQDSVSATTAISTLRRYYCAQGTNAGTITIQEGYSVSSGMIGGVYNRAFVGAIPEGTNRHNLYMSGTAENYLAGATTIAVTSTSPALQISQSGTGSALNVTGTLMLNGLNLQTEISNKVNSTNGAATGLTITGTKETKVALAAANIDLATGNLFTKTISATTTFTVSNVPASGSVMSIILELTNGGAFTVNFWAGVKWAGGIAPTLMISGTDIIGFYTHDGGTTWRAFLIAKDSK